MKGVIVGLIIGILSIILSMGLAFADTPSAWAGETIRVLENQGDLKNEFFGNYQSSLTRLEAATICVTVYEKLQGSLQYDSSLFFADTDDIYALKAATIGITDGIAPNKFGPNEFVTREQFATMIVRTLELAGHKLYLSVYTYNDDVLMSPWAKDSIYKAREHNLLNGLGDNNFTPFGKISREQALVIYSRTIENYSKEAGLGVKEISWETLEIDEKDKLIIDQFANKISFYNEGDHIITRIVNRESSNIVNVVLLSVVKSFENGLGTLLRAGSYSETERANFYRTAILNIQKQASGDENLILKMNDLSDAVWELDDVLDQMETMDKLSQVEKMSDVFGYSGVTEFGTYFKELGSIKDIAKVSTSGMKVLTTQYLLNKNIIEELELIQNRDAIFRTVLDEYKGDSVTYILQNFSDDMLSFLSKPLIKITALGEGMDFVMKLTSDLGDYYFSANSKLDSFIMLPIYNDVKDEVVAISQDLKRTPSAHNYKKLQTGFYLMKHTRMAMLEAVKPFANETEKKEIEAIYNMIKDDTLESFFYNAKSDQITILEVDKIKEQILIKNNNTEPIDLKGFKILSVTGGQTFIFDNQIILPGDTLSVGKTSSDPDVSWGDENLLNNQSKDDVQLFNSDGTWIFTYEDDAYYRPGDVSIIEMDKVKEVVTIKNSGNVTVNLEGWTLISERDSEPFVFPAYGIKAGEIITVGKESSGSTISWGDVYRLSNENRENLTFSDHSVSYEFKDNYYYRPGDVSIIGMDKVKEVVTIKNSGNVTVNLESWTLISERDSEPFVFPAYCIKSGETITVGKESSGSTISWGDVYRLSNENRENLTFSDKTMSYIFYDQ